MLRPLQRVSGVFLCLSVLLLLPSIAYAQAAITGVVRDTSGGVLPGVTVEAASPALIEKVRSVVTDDTGQYRMTLISDDNFSALQRTLLMQFALPDGKPVLAEPQSR